MSANIIEPCTLSSPYTTGNLFEGSEGILCLTPGSGAEPPLAEAAPGGASGPNNFCVIKEIAKDKANLKTIPLTFWATMALIIGAAAGIIYLHS